MSTKKFYMVYRLNGSSPKVRHASHALAKAEAQRLADKQPKDTFYVLGSRGGPVVAAAPAPTVEQLEAENTRLLALLRLAHAAEDARHEQVLKLREQLMSKRVDEMHDTQQSETDVNRARLIVDHTRWVASKLRPRSYGEPTSMPAGFSLTDALTTARERGAN